MSSSAASQPFRVPFAGPSVPFHPQRRPDPIIYREPCPHRSSVSRKPLSHEPVTRILQAGSSAPSHSKRSLRRSGPPRKANECPRLPGHPRSPSSSVPSGLSSPGIRPRAPSPPSSDSAPEIVVLKGESALPARLNAGSNKSLVGYKDGAHIAGKGIIVYNATDAVLQNPPKIGRILGNDCIAIRNSTRFWVDHDEFAPDMSQGPDLYASLEQGGQVDIIRAPRTGSPSPWNYSHDHWKPSLFGIDAELPRNLDSGRLHVSYHDGRSRKLGHPPAPRPPLRDAARLQQPCARLLPPPGTPPTPGNQVLVEGNVFPRLEM
ncbi:hypothetical protein LX36DRAFT_704780 [Colletotrichum falcatum]|nr:hypothetical protein LX36DRAFT_704780 [Colletotrichum falcatum]